jgi:cytochrome d ubiquinol oxidase subunit I
MDGVENREGNKCRVGYSPAGLQISEADLQESSPHAIATTHGQRVFRTCSIDKMPEKIHWFSGVVVGISGLASGAFVICANAWMNHPEGFDWVNGKAINIDPVQAMFNEAALSQVTHMLIASFEATGFAVAGLHAFLLYKDRQNKLHLSALKIALCFGAVAALLQPLSGDFSAKDVAKRQPLKLAAMESHFNTEKGAPLYLGGIPNLETETVDYGIAIPKMLSFLAFADFDAEVKGLNDFKKELWPPITIVHIAFQVMVGIGSVLALIALIFFYTLKFRPTWLLHSNFLKILILVTPLGFLAIEAGWVVTEVGRQPWIIYNIMKTADALTPMPGLAIPFFIFFFIYILLALIVTIVMRNNIRMLGKG